ncbi:hypothetical protein GIB67_010975 [Kingdonia uniflora]|uniref:non-specific serine/threonine protein kinase n=1 Tax=Kingdonia uniflora TaxID=39325 RepID=A0A7J7MMG3_9MAGN|nr:hypothetical protein GIB67_010975 [Kingdonia uniflora]
METKRSVLMQKYELGRLLGQGTFAKVYYAKNIKSGQSVAIKIFDKEKVTKGRLSDQIKREVSTMRLVGHSNVVRLYEVMATKFKIYFVMEYAKGGELFNRVAKGKLKEKVARKYFQQLISAVDYCHSRGVYHRDLKPENLLLDDNGNLKISDFGLSALAETKHQDGLLHTACGTPAYVAPEVISKTGYDGVKSDIWSCGVILFVLLAGYFPFADSSLIEMYRNISNGKYKCPNWFPAEVCKLLLKILDPNPNTRISIAKIMENSWFKKGLNSSSKKCEVDIMDIVLLDVETAFRSDAKQEQESIKPSNFNAFDIISLSAGFDLSGLFVESDHKIEALFTSRHTASAIISKLEEVAKFVKLKINKEGGLLKLEGLKKGRKGLLSIEAEIFEVTPSFHLVEMKKSSGDTLEYQNTLKHHIRPALKDIVWTWQGDHQLQQPQEQQQQQQL